MKILIVTPARPSARAGNWMTAARYRRHAEKLGHDTQVATEWKGEDTDLMIALHARRSADSIARFARTFPERPLIVVLTGTDLYRDIRIDRDARRSLELATRLIVLQERGPEELDPALRSKTRVIFQSASPVARRAPLKRHFEILVIGHLREEKDPFRAAYASTHLPPSSRIRIVQIGAAFSPEFAREARRLARMNPRYLWRGELAHSEVRRLLARAPLMVLASRLEGGANVVCEACLARTPVIASDVRGNVGMLGEDYEGYYPLEDERALAALLARAESDPEFHARLSAQCADRAALFTPEREREGLRKLLSEL